MKTSIDVAEAILTACKLGDLWKNKDFDLRQKVVSPKGLNWDRENENYRTISENEALRVFRLFLGSYKNEDKEKTGKSFDFSGLVDYTDKSSNFFEDILRLDRFAQSVEDELKRIVPAEEGESKRSMNSIEKQPI